MYLSEKMNEAILGNKRTFQAKLKIGETEIKEGFLSLKEYSRSIPDEYMSVGGAVSSYVEVKMWKPEIDLENKETEISIGMILDGEEEWVPLGLFTVEKPENDDGVIQFTAYDRIKSKMCGAYFSELKYPADGKEVLEEISKKTGIPIDTSNLLEGVLIQQRAAATEVGVDENGNETSTTTYVNPFDGYTYREALGYIAQLHGKFATADRTGTVVFRWYEEIEYSLQPNRYYDDLVTNEQVFSVGAVSCQTGERTLTAGEGTVNIRLDNPVMNQEQLEAIYETIKELQFLPAAVSFLGDMRLELGDIIKVYDKAGNLIRIPIMNIVQDFDGGLLTKVQSYGITEQEAASSKGPTAQKLDRVYTDLFLVKELIGNKANFEYVYAKVGELESLKAKQADFETATAQNFNATNAEIQTLSGEFASFKAGEFESLKAQMITTETLESAVAAFGYLKTSELETEVGKFGYLKTTELETEVGKLGYATITQLDAVTTRTESLEANVADITTLVNGNLTSDNIHSLTLNSSNVTIADGTIKNAMIESLAFSKISGIDINTTNLTIHSEDGKSTWSDNTIQISDTNRVRVQIGKDASDDYTLAVWDAAGNLIWDALGATENTIQRKIIRDAVVADDAAIAGSKLDIESVVEEVNGATTKLKSTTILLNEDGQTLDVAFKALETTVEDQESRVTANTTDISVMQGQITTLIAEDTTIKGDYEALVSRYNSTVTDVDSIKTTIGEHTTLLDSQGNDILAVTSRVATVETSLDEFSVSLSETNQTVSDNYTTLKEYTDSAVDGIEIGGRNFIRNSAFRDGTNYWILSYGFDYLSLDNEKTFNGHSTAKISVSGLTGSKWYGFMNKNIPENPMSMLAGETWTISCYYYIEEISTIDEEFSFEIKGTMEGTTSETTIVRAGDGLNSSKAVEGVWTKIEKTCTLKNNYHNCQAYAWVSKNGTVWFADFKLEKGTKATDWTPAPEDVDAKFVNYSTTTEMESAIELSKTSILSTVSETYTTKSEYTTLNGTVTSMETRLSTAEQKITKDGITTIVGDYYTTLSDVQTEISGIEIGGRNLLRNSDFSNGTKFWNYTNAVMSVVTDNTFEQCLSFYTTAAGSVNNRIHNDTTQFNHEIGETYTLSFWVKGDVETTLTASCTGGQSNCSTHDVTTKWVKHTKTYTATSGGSLTLWPDEANVTIYLANVKLEKGAKATDWTPAPEDVESDISSAQTTANAAQTAAATNTSNISALVARVTVAESSITQLSDSIELRVEKAGVISAINQTAETITIDASKVNLSGYVTIENLATAGATTIDGANITTGKISADRIDVDGLFAKDITANGTITGANLVGGCITTTDGTLGELSIENGKIQSQNVGGLYRLQIIQGKLEAHAVPVDGVFTCMFQALGDWISLSENGVTWLHASTSDRLLNVDGTIVAYKSLESYGTISEGGTALSDKYLAKTGGTLSGNIAVNYSTASYAQVSVKNPLQEGRLVVASGGTFGLNSVTHNKWLVSCDTSGNVTLNGNANTATTAKQVSTTIGDGTTAAVLRQSGGSGVMGLSIVTTNSAGTSVFHALLSTASDGTVTRQWVYPSEVVKITGGTFTGTVAAPTLQCDVLKSKSGTVSITMNEAAFKPTTSNAYTLGSSNYLWSTVYAKTSSINTSDELEKDILSVGITEAHENLFMDLEPILYRWKQFDWEGHVPDRIHCGLGARRTAELAEKHGFTMEDLAFLCRDDLEEVLPDGRTERYGIRYGELHGLEIHMIQKNYHNIATLETDISLVKARQSSYEDRLNYVSQQLQEVLSREAQLISENTQMREEINNLRSQLQAQA